MDKQERHGSLQDRPLSFLLFDLWTRKRSGQLSLKINNQKSVFNIVEGKLAVDTESLDENSFRQSISEQNAVDGPLLEQSLSLAKQQKISWIKACLLLDIMTPEEFWIRIRDHGLSNFLPWFDKDGAVYSFDPRHQIDRAGIYCLLSTLDVILRGIRGMHNVGLFKAHLPSGDSGLLALYPRHLSQIELLPHEEYLFHLISSLQSVKDIYEKSELGLKETQKTLFIFLSLGLFSLPMSKTDRDSGQDLSAEELHRILDVFNKKCAYTFKYIGKEIGPVSMNILEKALDESKSRLSPLFQKASLQADGQIDLLPVQKVSDSLSRPELKREFLAGLNEILVAEVLAVKKILGEEHEAALVKNLKKIEL